MKNTLDDLNDHLFAALERLNDEDLQGDKLIAELKRCEGIVKIGSVIVDNADLKLRAFEMAGNNQALIPKLMRDPERLS